MLDRRRMIRAWAAHDADLFRGFCETARQYGFALPTAPARVLDIGCGMNAPMTICLSAAGSTVTGLDMQNPELWGLGWSWSRYRRFRQTAGWARTARKFMGELVYDRLYFQELAARTGMRLSADGLDLRTLDTTRLPLPDAWADLVHSNATWEHVLDVPAANREVARVLKPGGLASIEIHLFPSISGGHDLPWKVPGTLDLGNVRPWRHLTDPTWRPHVPLNRFRESQYRAAFSETPGLTIREWRTEYTEGLDHLTPGLREQLAGYDERDLTTRSIIVIVQKTGS